MRASGGGVGACRTAAHRGPPPLLRQVQAAAGTGRAWLSACPSGPRLTSTHSLRGHTAAACARGRGGWGVELVERRPRACSVSRCRWLAAIGEGVGAVAGWRSLAKPSRAERCITSPLARRQRHPPLAMNGQRSSCRRPNRFDDSQSSLMDVPLQRSSDSAASLYCAVPPQKLIMVVSVKGDGVES